MISNVQADIHQNFVTTVKESRGRKLEKAADTPLFEGDFFAAQQAVDLGLIDGIGTLEEVCYEKFGPDCVLVEMTSMNPYPSWLSRFVP
eukprot:CAMPEP_0175133482 /NCGR_PEP_ID=MMETSP0087-20121206/7671_1 /TAXON_ID=136419 /ORGANISM="Unknown Unknown, Strain D1" /LENGTH=88 /DNA_ID=CAMNT_0016415985 /DNA_START=431 /DNA_END=694 /DNA_ORIENTATION=-